jgi:CheY-like chemotaxis protein
VIVNYAAFVGEELALAEAGDLARPWASVSRDLAQIQRAAERAAGFTHQLMTFAKKGVAHAEPLSVNEVIQGFEASLRGILGGDIALQLRLGPELWRVQADPADVERILESLATNSREAMHGGGTLVVSTANLVADEAYLDRHPQAASAGSYVRLQVSDTGSGMIRAIVDRAFDPFFTTKTGQLGSGLGLATLYGIVRQAGGHAVIESEVGQGTTVGVMWPASEQLASRVDPGESQRPSADERPGGVKILYVEDDNVNALVVRRILRQRRGIEIEVAATGREAIEIALRDRPNLVLLDLNLPDASGEEILQRLQGDPRTAGCPVVIVSGDSSVDRVHDLAPLGVVAALGKPYEIPELLELVDRLAGGGAGEVAGDGEPEGDRTGS